MVVSIKIRDEHGKFYGMYRAKFVDDKSVITWGSEHVKIVEPDGKTLYYPRDDVGSIT